MIDINELRRLTQAATPGPWKVGQYLGSPRQFVIHMDVGDKGRGSDVAFTSANFGNDETIANARLIAAANPTAISELLDRLEAAESDALEQARLLGMSGEREAALLSKLEAAEKAITEACQRGYATWQEEIEKERDALQAQIERMERQEPIGKFIQHPSHGMFEQDGYGYNPDARPLYALPGAKGEEK